MISQKAPHCIQESESNMILKLLLFLEQPLQFKHFRLSLTGLLLCPQLGGLGLPQGSF